MESLCFTRRLNSFAKNTIYCTLSNVNKYDCNACMRYSDGMKGRAGGDGGGGSSISWRFVENL